MRMLGGAATSQEAVPDHGAVLGCSRFFGDDYCVPFNDSSPPRSHTPVMFTAYRVGSPRAPALRQEVEVGLAKGALEITLSPGPGFTVVSCWWN